MDYQTRTDNLKSLGFIDYQDYLTSPLWKIIKNVILRRDQCECRNPRCPYRKENLVKQVHHLSYTPGILLGVYPHMLLTLCQKCHEWCERDNNGKKIPLAEVFWRTLSLYSSSKGGLNRKGYSNKKLGRWFKNGAATNQGYARTILSRLQKNLPSWYSIVVQMALEGRFGARGAEYLGLAESPKPRRKRVIKKRQ